LRKLEGASLSPSSSSQRRQQQQQQQQQQSVPSTSSSPTTQADHYFLQTKPELAQLLQKTAKYNEALLKHEQNEIDSLAKYIKEIEAAEKNPYEEEFTNEKLREARRKLETSSRKVKECFEEDRREGEGSSLATRCRAVVLEYEKCGQEALEAFVAARS
jgi:hypothetical protein